MTLVDIKNALFSHFLTETTFNLKEDISSIQLDTSGLDEAFLTHKETLFAAALDDYVKSGVLILVADGLYLLTQPINTFNQSVVLSPIAAEMVADLVNIFAEDEGYTANKMALTSDDISTLCHFCHALLDDDSTPSQP